MLTERFTAETGIEVELAPVERVNSPVGSWRRRADALPDVLFAPLNLVVTLSENQILDAEAATAAIATLGKDSFATGPLTLVADGDQLQQSRLMAGGSYCFIVRTCLLIMTWRSPIPGMLF